MALFKRYNGRTLSFCSRWMSIENYPLFMFIKMRLQHRCFPVKFKKFYQNTYFEEHLRTTTTSPISNSFTRYKPVNWFTSKSLDWFLCECKIYLIWYKDYSTITLWLEQNGWKLIFVSKNLTKIYSQRQFSC